MSDRKKSDTSATKGERALERPAAQRWPFTWLDEWERWFEDVRRDFDRRYLGQHWPWRDLLRREPPTDLLDNGDHYILSTELPGIRKEDIEVRVTSEAVDIKAQAGEEKEEKARDYYYRERSHRSFHRSFPFPAEVVPEQAQASLKDGVLEVRVPKREPTAKREPFKVEVE